MSGTRQIVKKELDCCLTDFFTFLVNYIRFWNAVKSWKVGLGYQHFRRVLSSAVLSGTGWNANDFGYYIFFLKIQNEKRIFHMKNPSWIKPTPVWFFKYSSKRKGFCLFSLSINFAQSLCIEILCRDHRSWETVMRGNRFPHPIYVQKMDKEKWFSLS